MTKQVYLVDLIGVHTGMHYYHNAFCELFDKNGDVEIAVLSNYDHQSHRAFFPYLFNGNMVSKALKLLFAFVKLALFLATHRRSYFVYLSFGNRIDRLFMLLARIGGKRFILDIHDLYDPSKESSDYCKRSVINKLKRINKVIIHSERVQKQLDSFGYSGVVILVPHFRYNFESIPQEEQSDVTDLFDSRKINLLFFGHIRESKGIKELFKLINGISDTKVQNAIHLVIVGSDTNQCIVQICCLERSQIVKCKVHIHTLIMYCFRIYQFRKVEFWNLRFLIVSRWWFLTCHFSKSTYLNILVLVSKLIFKIKIVLII